VAKTRVVTRVVARPGVGGGGLEGDGGLGDRRRWGWLRKRRSATRAWTGLAKRVGAERAVGQGGRGARGASRAWQRCR